ncbi:MAG: hypothetical protein WBE76_15525 [Terracidiphilus sp.]
MNRYIFIRRLRGPAFLVLVGVLALLAQAHILGWGQSWPLYLILAGVLLLAERAALASEGYPPFSGTPYPGAIDPATGQPVAPQASTASTSIVPVRTQPFENDPDGGHS